MTESKYGWWVQVGTLIIGIVGLQTINFFSEKTSEILAIVFISVIVIAVCSLFLSVILLRCSPLVRRLIVLASGVLFPIGIILSLFFYDPGPQIAIPPFLFSYLAGGALLSIFSFRMPLHTN